MEDAAHRDTDRQRERDTHTHTPPHIMQRGLLAYSEELLLASPLVHPGGCPGNVIQEVGTGVHICLADAVTILARVGCCKPAAITHVWKQWMADMHTVQSATVLSNLQCYLAR